MKCNNTHLITHPSECMITFCNISLYKNTIFITYSLLFPTKHEIPLLFIIGWTICEAVSTWCHGFLLVMPSGGSLVTRITADPKDAADLGHIWPSFPVEHRETRFCCGRWAKTGPAPPDSSSTNRLRYANSPGSWQRGETGSCGDVTVCFELVPHVWMCLTWGVFFVVLSNDEGRFTASSSVCVRSSATPRSVWQQPGRLRLWSLWGYRQGSAAITSGFFASPPLSAGGPRASGSRPLRARETWCARSKVKQTQWPHAFCSYSISRLWFSCLDWVRSDNIWKIIWD